jgi:predicted acylesterase/phospholipase RssA
MKYDLVFEGGGAKGMVFVGAIEEFINRGHTFGRLLGTSAGAITATLLASGYSHEEMLSALNERENGKSVFTTFMGDPAPFTREQIRDSAIRSLLRAINVKVIPDIVEERLDDAIAQTLAENSRSRHFFSFVEQGGWYAADHFVTWLRKKLDSGSWRHNERRFSKMSLAEFYAETQVDLSVVASDTTDGRLLVLNHHTAPDCPLVWAVRMSMSIPLLWNEVTWATDWGAYMGNPIDKHAVVDGGMLSNFPIELFISDESYVTRLMGPKLNQAVLGLLVDESIAVPQSAGTRGFIVDVNVKPQELRTVQRLERLVNTMTTAHDKMVMEEFESVVVRLPAGGYGTTEFDMSDGRRDALVQAGRNAMKMYFEKSATATRGAEARRTGLSKDKVDKMAAKLLRS